MNRKILFRGKRKDNGEFVYGNLFIPDKPDTPTQICIGTNVVRITYDVVPETVGQYTGLTDKNGRKIFEGDILKFSNDDGETSLHIVQWSDDYSSWATQCTDMKYTEETMDFWDDYRECYKVIGNIHDNPDLLEVGI